MKILMKMTGSIAMFKACGLISKLVQNGHEVQVVASSSALEFIGVSTLEGLSRKKVVSDLWEPGHAMDHINLVRWADLIVAIPASAHFINRIAAGVGDDLLTTMFLAHDFKKPYLLAPAMNTAMYQHPATQKSLATLKDYGVKILESASGVLACGETGYGRLLEVDQLLEEIQKFANQTAPTNSQAPAMQISTDLKSSVGSQPTVSTKVLITAGGTSEPIDEIRVISNRSTGRTGSAIADHLYDMGFEVTLLLSQTGSSPSRPVEIQRYESYEDLKTLMRSNLSEKNISTLVHLAAVSDYSVDSVHSNGQSLKDAKIPSGVPLQIHLKPNPKLISMAKAWSKNKKMQLIGFKLTSKADSLRTQEAVHKILVDAAADFVVHNDSRDLKDPLHAHPFRIFGKDLKVEFEGTSLSQLKNKIGEMIARRSV